MSIPEELSLSGLAALGTLGSVCAILLRSTHQNLKTLDSMRRDATAATEKLRQELHDHDETIFRLQGICAEYRYAITALEDDIEYLQQELQKERSARHNPDPRWSEINKQFKRNPEDVL